MKKCNVTKAGYDFTFPELKKKSLEMSGLFRRDEVKLNQFGVSSTRLTNYEQKVAELDSIPSDLETETNKMIATELKNNLADELRFGLRTLSVYAKCAYKFGSAQLYRYTNEAPSKLNDAEIALRVKVLADLSKNDIETLAPYGLTIEYCDALLAKRAEFEDLFVTIATKVAERDTVTELRWTKANEVYKELIQLCEIGKLIWEQESEAMYNDYVLYPSSSSSKTPEEEVIENDNTDEGNSENG